MHNNIALLDDIRVLELAGAPAQAICGRYFADLGAQVVMLEAPRSGSPLRFTGPFLDDLPGPDRSGLFLYTATGKFGVTLDYRHPEGAAILRRLLAQADLVIDNGDLAGGQVSIDWREINPRLVLLDLRKFSRGGEYENYLATELQSAAMGGWMAQLGEPGRNPLITNSLTCVSFVAGVVGASAALAAVMRARSGGEGCHVELSDHEALLACTRYNETYFSYTGTEIKRCGKSFTGWTPTYRIFEAADGFVSCAASTDSQVESFMTLAGVSSDRFATREERYEHGSELVEKLNAWTSSHSRNEVFHQAQAWRVPMGSVATVDEVFDSEQLKERGFFDLIDHPATGSRRYPGVPVLVDGRRPVPVRRAPMLGEHNGQIFCDELGLSRKELLALAEMGVV
jgi:crotonobetainyl-CoA:carnitine CoA-transferase CaiB-like acyl-CoA transferase